jgi:lipoprotein NlpI
MQLKRMVLLVCLVAGRLYAEPASADRLCHSAALTTPAAALQSCSAAIDAGEHSDADLARLLNSRGIAHQMLQQHDAAIKDYNQAIRLDGNYSEAYSNRGSAYHSLGIYDRAIADYTTAVTLDPRAQVSFRSRGIAHFCLGHFDEAQKDLTTAYQLDPADPFVAIWLYLARVRRGEGATVNLKGMAASLKLGEWPGQVIQLFSGALSPEDYLSSLAALDPVKDKLRRGEALFFLGEYSLLGGQTAKAEKFFQSVIETHLTEDFEYTAALSEMERLRKP